MFRWYNEEKDPDYFVPDTDDEEEYEEADIEVREINLSQFIVICSENTICLFCSWNLTFLFYGLFSLVQNYSLLLTVICSFCSSIWNFILEF